MAFGYSSTRLVQIGLDLFLQWSYIVVKKAVGLFTVSLSHLEVGIESHAAGRGPVLFFVLICLFFLLYYGLLVVVLILLQQQLCGDLIWFCYMVYHYPSPIIILVLNYKVGTR